MASRKSTIIILSFVISVLISICCACSCIPSHPQRHYCTADFVILARVQREYVTNDYRMYKIRVRKEFKVSEKAQIALKHGQLLTPSSSSLCGVTLKPGQLYVIAGHVYKLKPRVNLCGYHERWMDISKRQKKGFNRLYKNGCQCGVNYCWGGRCKNSPDACNWTTFNYFNKTLDCQSQQGVCMKTNDSCTWTKTKLLAQCLKNTKVKYHSPSRGGQGRRSVQ